MAVACLMHGLAAAGGGKRLAVACLMHGLAAAGGGGRLACSLPNARSSSCWRW